MYRRVWFGQKIRRFLWKAASFLADPLIAAVLADSLKSVDCPDEVHWYQKAIIVEGGTRVAAAAAAAEKKKSLQLHQLC